MEEKPYREGDDPIETIEQTDNVKPMPVEESVEESKVVEIPSPEKEQPVEKDKSATVTAVLLALFEDGRMEASTKLPGIPMQRQADLRDIRIMCRSMYDDVSMTLNGQATAHETANAMRRMAAQAHMDQVKASILKK